MLNLSSAQAGNLAAEFFAIWVNPAQYHPDQYAQRTLTLIEGVHDQLRRYSDYLQLCRTPDDILAAYAAKKFGVLIGIEGGHSIDDSSEDPLDRLREYHRLGARYMTLTWSNSNNWAESSGDLRPAKPGLTPFGHEVVAEMNRLGMMVDVSHVSDQTFWDVLNISTAPIIASHSSARALTTAPRNLTDDMLKALAAKNGVAMVNFFPAFIDENWRTAWNAQREERTAAQEIAAAPYKGRYQPVPFHVSEKFEREFAARRGRAPFNS